MGEEKKQKQHHKLSIQIGVVELKPTKFIDGLPQKVSDFLNVFYST